MHPLDLIDAAPWRRVVFTTYALSLSFVEAIILEKLVRGGGQGALILADPEGIRAGLSEQGARRAGRDYELEPVKCTTGVFHPKLGLFFNGNDAHMLVGSGNLTFGGWGMNLEAVEHLHPSFAAEVFDDAADMFELLAIADQIRCGVSDRFEEIAKDLRLAAVGSPRNGEFRLLHSIGGPIGQQLVDLANDLGGAKRINVVSPYFDKNGGAVARLAENFGCDDISLHVHPSSPVRGIMGINWPQGTNAKSVCIDEPFGDDTRLLHAKCFEIICRRGRLLMTGSANATRAALEVGNVEASLVRIQRGTSVGWVTRPCDPPAQLPQVEVDDDKETLERVGVLRAALERDRIHGLVLEPKISGVAKLQVVLSAGLIDLGSTDVDANGNFEAPAPDIEMQSWSGGRMVVRIEQGKLAAEGFVSVASVAEIIRRAGAMAPRLLAMLSGTETPEDVAAILSWFKDDPERILQSASTSGSASKDREKEPIWVPVEALTTAGSATQTGNDRGGHGEPAWQRALWLVKSAFSEKRGPWKSGTDEDDHAEVEDDRESAEDRQKRLRKEEQAKANAMHAFEGLLEDMLAKRHNGQHAAAAFALAHYLADRIRPTPDQVQSWLARIFNSIKKFDPAEYGDIAAASLLAKATDGQARAAVRARRFLIRCGIDPAELTLDLENILSFMEILEPNWDGQTFLNQVCAASTPAEQVAAYLKAADENGPRSGYEELESGPYGHKLLKALDDHAVRIRICVIEELVQACPQCFLVMPTASQQELRLTGITIHRGHLILCKEL
ncbi:hypothetical protein [Parasphingorhabdus sp.]|uniref:hypothetical protein n=1 Tax=Parasphingorhabdus sp. TaxID=2709688 RepID=UPI003A8D667F